MNPESLIKENVSFTTCKDSTSEVRGHATGGSEDEQGHGDLVLLDFTAPRRLEHFTCIIRGEDEDDEGLQKVLIVLIYYLKTEFQHKLELINMFNMFTYHSPSRTLKLVQGALGQLLCHL